MEQPWEAPPDGAPKRLQKKRIFSEGPSPRCLAERGSWGNHRSHTIPVKCAKKKQTPDPARADVDKLPVGWGKNRSPQAANDRAVVDGNRFRRLLNGGEGRFRGYLKGEKGSSRGKEEFFRGKTFWGERKTTLVGKAGLITGREGWEWPSKASGVTSVTPAISGRKSLSGRDTERSRNRKDSPSFL